METIFIRSIEEHDAEDLFYLVTESKKHLGLFLPWAYSIHKIEDELKFIQSVHNKQLSKQQYTFVIEKSGKIVGMIDLHNVDFDNYQAEVGYWLSEKYTGQGIISEALQQIHNFAFKKLKLHKLIILVDEKNEKSIQVAKRANYFYEGKFIEDQYYNDTYHNFYRFAFINR